MSDQARRPHVCNAVDCMVQLPAHLPFCSAHFWKLPPARREAMNTVAGLKAAVRYLAEAEVRKVPEWAKE